MKAMRGKMGISLREVASATGMSHVNVKDIETDKIKPSFEKVMRLLHVYHADIPEFLRVVGYLPENQTAAPRKPNSVPIISWVVAGQWRETCESFEPGGAEEWVDTDVKGENLFAVYVVGDSMEPEFNEGDIIVLNPDIKPDSGDYIIAKNEEGETTLKQLKQYGDIQVLHPLNSKYSDIELYENHEYVIVGKVVEKKKRY